MKIEDSITDYEKTVFLRYAKQLFHPVSLSNIRCNSGGKNFKQYTCTTDAGALDICFRYDGIPDWFTFATTGGVIRISGKLQDWNKLKNINLDKL